MTIYREGLSFKNGQRVDMCVSCCCKLDKKAGEIVAKTELVYFQVFGEINLLMNILAGCTGLPALRLYGLGMHTVCQENDHARY
jgi:hypothetical protein